MASWTRREFPTLEAALEYLNGIIVGSVNLHANGADVDGLTLVINDGTADRTVTFVPAKGVNWTLEEIITQIEGTHANLVGCASPKVITAHRAGALGLPDRRLSIDGSKAPPGVGYTVDSSGTGNAALGFSTAADEVQTIIPNTQVQVFTTTSRDPNQKWVVVLYA